MVYPDIKYDFDFSEWEHNKIGEEPPSNPGKGTKSQQMEYPKGDYKIGKVMHEFKTGTLHSRSKHGPKVKSLAQARAIALSEQRKYEKGGYKK